MKIEICKNCGKIIESESFTCKTCGTTICNQCNKIMQNKCGICGINIF